MQRPRLQRDGYAPPVARQELQAKLKAIADKKKKKKKKAKKKAAAA